MRNLLLIASLVGSLAACAGRQVATTGDELALNRARTQYRCPDPVLEDQAESGGESLTHGGPCWQPEVTLQKARSRRVSSDRPAPGSAAMPLATRVAGTPASLAAPSPHQEITEASRVEARRLRLARARGSTRTQMAMR